MLTKRPHRLRVVSWMLTPGRDCAVGRVSPPPGEIRGTGIETPIVLAVTTSGCGYFRAARAAASAAVSTVTLTSFDM
jgi:hypothetical protein